MPSLFTDSLNLQQAEAVATTDGPLLVVAGAGSGKTRVITHRIAHLIEDLGVAPWQVFAATFTNKAAQEMHDRVAKLVPGSDLARLTISTFHSICVGILRREASVLGLTTRFTICDDTDQIALIKDCLRNLGTAAGAAKPEEVRSFISAAKVRMLGPAQARAELAPQAGALCAQVYEQYQARLLANDAVDFDDLILHVVKIFQDYPDVLSAYHDRWKYILVDEYQDTNRVQWELVRLLALRHGNICVVGDEDQSIYSWRGAEIENLLKFPDLFQGARIVRLEQNYRSTGRILDAANAVIRRNKQRNDKSLWSDRGPGEPITMIVGAGEREEAMRVVETMRWLKRNQGRPYASMAVFYRVNALSRPFEDQLRESGIPYRVIGGIRFYDRAEVKDLLAYLRLCINPKDGVAMARIINRPARGIGEKSLAELYDAAVRRGVSLWDVLLDIANKAENAPAISGKARAGVVDFVVRVKEWGVYSENHPHATLEKILRDTQYEEALGSARDLDAITRRENIAELANALEQFHKDRPGDGLAGFLERVALISAVDQIQDDDALSLMSLHCAKGLEYDVVFMAGMEDPIFPSRRAAEEQGHFEEERRLFYVGITRARDLLFFSRADSRFFHGRPSYNTPSLFLREIPGELLRTHEDAFADWADRASEKQTKENSKFEYQNSKQLKKPADLQGDPSFAVAAEPSSASSPRSASPVPHSEGIFAVADRVVHPRLGAGAVVAATGEGDKRKVTVQFDAGLSLEILEKFGGLETAPADDLPY